MGVCADWLLPRILDLTMRQKQMIPFRRRIGQAAEGRVLDVGIGSGVNLMFLRLRCRTHLWCRSVTRAVAVRR
jgi:hypothetical protein